MTEAALRAQMCDIGQRTWQRSLIGATEGNLSCRLSHGRFLCTPTGLSKGHLTPEDLIVVDGEGRAESGKPSSEIRLHMRIYAHRSDCEAVVHAHPPISTGLALAGEALPSDLMPESMAVLGSVASVPFAMPGTEELPDAIEPFLPGHKAFLLSHHGAVTLGHDLLDAYHRMETLERIATSYVVAKLMGGPALLPAEALTRLAGLLVSGKV